MTIISTSKFAAMLNISTRNARNSIRTLNRHEDQFIGAGGSPVERWRDKRQHWHIDAESARAFADWYAQQVRTAQVSDEWRERCARAYETVCSEFEELGVPQSALDRIGFTAPEFEED